MSDQEINVTAADIFFPNVKRLQQQAERGEIKAIQYTSSDTAVKILQNQEVWLRNARLMNDYSEMHYGRALLDAAFAPADDGTSPIGERLKNFVDAINSKVFATADSYLTNLVDNTYIACAAIHKADDKDGKLSMWRAYGDTALVMNTETFFAEGSDLGVYSTEVSYHDEKSFNRSLEELLGRMQKHRSVLEKLHENDFSFLAGLFLITTVLGTKHPGFAEEKEYRVYFVPTWKNNGFMERHKSIETIGGIRQIVYKLPLRHLPKYGLMHADLPSLINKIIIGPTEFREQSKQVFKHILEQADVENVAEKVVCSSIPYRKA